MANLFQKIFGKREISPQKIDSTYYFFPSFHAGIYVNSEVAMTFSAVYRAISYISQTIGILPWSVFEDYNVKSSDPIHWLLARRPNPEMSPYDFKRVLTAHALAEGNGYAEIEFNNAGVPMALWPIHPCRINPMRNDSGELIYRCWDNTGGWVDLESWRIFHVRNLGSDGICGQSVIKLASRTIAMGIAAEQFGSNLMESQAVPSGVLEHPQKLSEEAATRLRDSFGKTYSGRENAGKIIVLEEGLKFSQLAFKPEDLQFIQSRQFTVEEIARWFGVPPHKLADMEHSTFSNIEHQAIEVITDCIVPWCKSFEEEADYKLLGKRRTNIYTKMNIRGLLRGDNASRGEYYTKMLQNGVYSINDVRELEDMAPIEHGDKHLVPLNQTTLENAVLAQEATATPVSTVSEGNNGS